jgi:hypothetical protein
MDGTAVKEFRESMNEPKVLKVDGRERLVVPAGWTEVKYQHPALAPIVIGTLTGVIDYLKENVDELVPDDILVHVKDPGTVEIRRKVEDEATSFRRHVYLQASTAMVGPAPFKFGEYQDAETFFIGLQAAFASTDDRETVLRLIASIRENSVRETIDDGVAQEVKVAGGVALVGMAPIPNPVALRPYRTFREVEQPASRFVLRAQASSGQGDKPRLALFEADGASWKLDAIRAVAAYLKVRLDADSIPVAVLA